MDSISYPEFSRIYNGLQKESNQLLPSAFQALRYFRQ